MAEERGDIVREFAETYVAIVTRLVGAEPLRIFLEKHFPGGELALRDAGTIAINTDRAKEVVKQFVAMFTDKIVAYFGFGFADHVMRSIYNTFSRKYAPNPNVLAAVLDIIPGGFLDEERTRVAHPPEEKEESRWTRAY